jgi:hypothetical protein
MRNVPILDRSRIRCIEGSFGFIPHRFLSDGFFSSLDHEELILYFFWILAADRFGMSFYGDKALAKHTSIEPMVLGEIRNSLVSKSLIAFKTPFVQVLRLPEVPVEKTEASAEHPARRILKSLEGGSR